VSLPQASTPSRGRTGLVLVLAAVAAAGPGLGQEGAPSASPSAAVAVTDERLQRVRERKQALERDLRTLRGQEQSLLGEVERLELEVRLRSEQHREALLLLQRVQQEMDVTLGRARVLESNIERARPQLAQRARDLYKLGELSYLRMLLSVDRPQDLLLGYRFVTALARRDRVRMASFRSDLATLERTRGELERKTTETQTLKVDLDRTRRSLDADRRRKTELLTRLVEKKELQAAFLQELEEAEGRLSGLISGLSEGEATVPMTAFRGSLAWPVQGKIRSSFGRHKHPRFDTYTVQNGIEIDAPLDTPVTAIHEGRVAYADLFRGYGMLVVIDHGGKHHTLYAHLGEVKVKVGQSVAAGTVVGTVGSSGIAGAGLYFEMRYQGRPQDPGDWLKGLPAAR
jgi:septal ring factor EnvC (AmiA/AmiB activator)